MRLAVSNIGWSDAQDDSILPMLKDTGVEAIEVAPGRIFETPALASVAQAQEIGAMFAQAGLPVVSMQALLFGQADLHLFNAAQDTKPLEDYLAHIIGLAGALGCGPLVFGSPKNRLRGDLSFDAAVERAVPVLRRIGAIASDHGTQFCLEANAKAYGCDFMTRLDDARTMASAVGCAGVGVVVDTGNMIMEAEPPSAVLGVGDLVGHVHLSAPGLAPVMDHLDHITAVVGHLTDMGYAGGVTLEMRAPDDAAPVDTLLRNAAAIRKILDAA